MTAWVVLVVAGFALAGGAAAAEDSVPAAVVGLRRLGVKPWDNDFYLRGANITSCTEISHTIPQGQPYEGPRCFNSSKGGNIMIKAGRHLDSDVFKSFTSDGVNEQNMFVSNGCKDLGKKLSFYVKMDVTIEIGEQVRTLKSLRLGQAEFHPGAFVTEHPWMIGSDDCFVPYTPSGLRAHDLKCPTRTADGKWDGGWVVFDRFTKSTDTVSVRLDSGPDHGGPERRARVAAHVAAHDPAHDDPAHVHVGVRTDHASGQ
jgi:hypothetical protein